MAIDPSIYDQANKPSVALADPTQQLSQMATAQNAVNQNKLFQQQNAARLAIGQSIQQSTRPDGTIDTLNANLLNAAKPDAAYGAQQAATDQQALQNAQLTGSNQNMQQHIAMRGQLNNAFSALLAKPDLSKSDVLGTVGDLVAQGVIPPTMIGPALQSAPLDDPVALRAWAANAQRQNSDVMQQYHEAYGTARPQTDNRGTFSGIELPASRSGGYAPTTYTPNELSKPDLARTTTVGVNGRGAPLTGTTQNLLEQVDPGLLPGANPSSQPMAQPRGNSPLGDGRLPAALRGPNQAGAPSPPSNVPSAAPNASPSAPAASPGLQPMANPPPAPPAPRGIVTSLAPADEVQQRDDAAASTKGFTDVANQGTAAANQKAMLGNMLADSTKFTPGMEGVNDARAYVARQAPYIGRALGLDFGQVAAKEGFDKLSAAIALQQGAGSDQRLSVAGTANPTSKLSPDGVDTIIRQLQGNADYLQSKADLATKYSDRLGYRNFETTIQKNLDPRAFQLARLQSGQQQTDYINSLDAKSDRPTVEAAYRYGLQNGLIKPNAGGPTNGQ